MIQKRLQFAINRSSLTAPSRKFNCPFLLSPNNCLSTLKAIDRCIRAQIITMQCYTENISANILQVFYTISLSTMFFAQSMYNIVYRQLWSTQIPSVANNCPAKLNIFFLLFFFHFLKAANMIFATLLNLVFGGINEAHKSNNNNKKNKNKKMVLLIIGIVATPIR